MAMPAHIKQKMKMKDELNRNRAKKFNRIKVLLNEMLEVDFTSRKFTKMMRTGSILGSAHNGHC